MQSYFFAHQQQWVLVTKHEASFDLKKNKSQECLKRTQFPLAFPWACTIHMVQGLSLDEVVI